MPVNALAPPTHSNTRKAFVVHDTHAGGAACGTSPAIFGGFRSGVAPPIPTATFTLAGAHDQWRCRARWLVSNSDVCWRSRVQRDLLLEGPA
jgi:hypothetical protein